MADEHHALGLTGDEAAHARELRRRLALSFSAFDESHHRLWLRYAHTQVGSREAAHDVVADACRHLLANWQQALVQESLAAYAWTILKEHLSRWLAERGRQPMFTGTAAFEAAIRKALLGGLGDEFAVLADEMRLYAAIARLPERQYDVVVLRHVLGCTEEEVADCLGSDPATVRSHLRHARRKLARELEPGGQAPDPDGLAGAQS